MLPLARLARTWWVQVLAIFLASRVVSTGILLWFAAHQGANAWTGAAPSYPEFATIWDGTWYWIVATSGYPTELPLTDAGRIAENAWAFMPVYPFVVRAVMIVTGLGFQVAGVLVSVVCATVAALLFFRLMARFLPPGSALFAVALFCLNPVSAVLQVAYAESMHAMLLIWALLLLVRRSYWQMLPIVVVMALTRPSGLAFALAMALHFGHRWLVRRSEPFPGSQMRAAATVTAVSVVAGFAWLLIAALATGSLTAYTDTELAWRAPYIGYGHLVPFLPWFQAAIWWAEYLGAPAVLGIAVLLVGLIAVVLAMLSPWMRKLGLDIRFWVVSWLLYLLAVFFPQSSTWRLLFPAFPALGALAVPTSKWFRAALLIAFVGLQWWWVDGMWAVSGHDWTPP